MQERDDKELTTLMAKLEKANREPGGDEDGEGGGSDDDTTEDDSEPDDTGRDDQGGAKIEESMDD